MFPVSPQCNSSDALQVQCPPSGLTGPRCSNLSLYPCNQPNVPKRENASQQPMSKEKKYPKSKRKETKGRLSREAKVTTGPKKEAVSAENAKCPTLAHPLPRT